MNVVFARPYVLGSFVLAMIAVVVLSCATQPTRKPTTQPTTRPQPTQNTTNTAPSQQQQPQPQRPVMPEQTLSPSMQPGPAVSEIQREPDVRVRIASSEMSVKLDSESGQITLGPNDPNAPESVSQTFATPVTIRRDSQGFVIDGADRDVRWNLDALSAKSSTPIQFKGNRYPGRLVILPPTFGSNRLDIVEYVPLEDYLPGVLAKELFGNWDPQAFRAQAVASRSYALYQRKLRAGQHYDMVDTTGSQVYSGLTQNPTALNAVRDTRGVVLTWQGYVVPAFFSADAGNRGQNAADAFPGFPQMTPLMGSDYKDLPITSPHQEWGPITRFGPNLSRRLQDWGQARGNPLGQLKTITNIEVLDENHLGRPRLVRITDSDGQVFDIPAENVRLAANRDVPGVPQLPPVAKLKSSDFQVQSRENGRSIVFRGFGFGHGVGMSQWHAQTLATKGYPYRDILEIFYPNAKIEVIYN